MRKVLVVEDEVLIALLIEDMVTDLGFEVVGPATRLKNALRMAQEENFDFAILDINLANEKSFPVADALRRRGIPFIFASGYGVQGLSEAYNDIKTIQKPFDLRELKRAVCCALS